MNPNPSFWDWVGKAQDQAKDLASKAQSKALEIAKQANELTLKSNATTVLLQGIGLTAAEVSAPTAEEKAKKTITGSSRQLDMHYITENILCMSFPYSSEKDILSGGNNIIDVAAFLKRKHHGHYMIWNLSEESYNNSYFAEQVLEYKFPGHPSPPLGLLFKICTSIESWLDADEENVAVIHCLTGKGRTTTVIACLLTWINEISTPMEALQYIADRRGISSDELTIPSQRRYIQYFANMLDGVRPRSEPLLLRRVILNSVPFFGDDGYGNAGCCPYIQLFKNGQLIATAIPSMDIDPGKVTDHTDHGKKSPPSWIRTTEGAVSFVVDVLVRGDVLLRCRHVTVDGARESMFRAAFHTGYVPYGVLRLSKAQLDGASNDPRFKEEFLVDLIFAPVDADSEVSANPMDPSNLASVSSSSVPPLPPGSQLPSSITFNIPVTQAPTSADKSMQPTPTPTDLGVVLDPLSKDSYDQMLHRDARFWEAVSSRSARARLRKSRKFLASSQEQFSIFDDLGPLSPTGSADDDLTGSGKVVVQGHVDRVISDRELIEQLARAEVGAENDDVTQLPVTPQLAVGAPTMGSTIDTTAAAELQALAELEKELGLTDIGSSTSSGTGNSISKDVDTNSHSKEGRSSSDVETQSKLDSDNLDELEQYLQSLSITK